MIIESSSSTRLELPFSVADALVALVLPLVVAVGFALAGWSSQQRLADLVWALALGLYLVTRKRFGLRLLFGESISGKTVALGLGIGVAWTFFGGAVVLIERLMAGYEHPIDPIWVVFPPLIELPVIPLVFSTLLIPFLEEITFRSIGYRGLLRRAPATMATVMVSAWFALLHYGEGDIMFVTRTFVFSLVMIWLTHRSRSLWPAVAAHVGHNSLVVALGAMEADIVGWGSTLT